MKLILYIFLTILLIGIVNAYYLCQDETDDSFIPCQVITPVISCDYYNATLTNLNTSVIEGINMTPVGDGTYNFTFSYTNVGNSYSITLCDNSTSSINVIQDEDPDINLWIVFFIVFFFLLIGGVVLENHIFIFAGGVLIMMMGVWIFSQGISVYVVSEYWVYPLAWIFTGIGIIMTVVSGLDMIRDLGGEK